MCARLAQGAFAARPLLAHVARPERRLDAPARAWRGRRCVRGFGLRAAPTAVGLHLFPPSVRGLWITSEPATVGLQAAQMLGLRGAIAGCEPPGNDARRFGWGSTVKKLVERVLKSRGDRA